MIHWAKGLTAAALVLCAFALAGCGDEPATTQKTLSEVTPDLAGADPRLVKIADQGSELLPGERAAFDARMKSLRGLPVVVNKWASWCGPCKAEAPELQKVAKKLGNRVAFLGIDLNDPTSDAEAFLRKFPLPYPSYTDPDLKISKDFPPAKSAPVTNFYDAEGRLVHTQAAQLGTAAEIEETIERYAGPIGAGPSN